MFSPSPSCNKTTGLVKETVKKQMKKVETDKLIGIKEFKKMDATHKFQYLWGNYRKQVISFGIKLIVIVVLFMILVLNNDSEIRGIVINSDTDISQSVVNKLNSDLFDRMEDETFKIQIELTASLNYYLDDESRALDNYEVVQLIVEQMEKKKLDFLTGDLETLTVLAYSDFFIDLTEVMSEEQLIRCKPYLRYIDQKILDDIKEAVSSKTAIELNIPDCRRPEEMEQPIPVMIDMKELAYFSELYTQPEDLAVIGIIENTTMDDEIREVIDFILAE